ncbi:hypothetical protein [Streptomyces sp. TRM68367]|uniref:hypothetical protein n=1 Tax=Streptomyces sp. TRM68367 TaxID=2758415 RepID=UPI0021D2CB77|nr:hypothetical protein [Streptomyces sp. TRM68367]
MLRGRRADGALLPQLRDGKDLHHWLTTSGLDHLPPEWVIHFVGGTLVLDTGPYKDALETGRLQRRPMFTALDGEAVVWADGAREQVDVVLLATGYRPNLGYLAKLGALDEQGAPLHTAAYPPPTRAWSTSAWSSSVPSPRTRCAASDGTRST